MEKKRGNHLSGVFQTIDYFFFRYHNLESQNISLAVYLISINYSVVSYVFALK